MVGRREFFGTLAGVAASAACVPAIAQGVDGSAPDAPPRTAATPTKRRFPIGVSTYSFWRFQHDDWRPVPKCLEAAAEIGFDGVEILQRQLVDTSPQRCSRSSAALRRWVCRSWGSPPTRVSSLPTPRKRQKNFDATVACLEQAYQLGIPTMRVNTGTWGTRKDFDDLMAHRGLEDPLPGHTDEDGFGWAIDAYRRLAVEAAIAAW